jgi:hypothetical protein
LVLAVAVVQVQPKQHQAEILFFPQSLQLVVVVVAHLTAPFITLHQQVDQVVHQVADIQVQLEILHQHHHHKEIMVAMVQAVDHHDLVVVVVAQVLLVLMELSLLLLRVMVATAQLGLATELHMQAAEQVVSKVVAPAELVELVAVETAALQAQ